MIAFFCALLLLLNPLSAIGAEPTFGMAVFNKTMPHKTMAQVSSSTDLTPSDSAPTDSMPASAAPASPESTELDPAELDTTDSASINGDSIDNTEVTEVGESARRSPQQVLEQLFTADKIQADWFVSSFLQQIPLEQIQGVLTEISSSFGNIQTIQELEAGYEIKFTGGTIPAQIRLTAEGQIAGLFFEPPLIPIALEDAIAILETAPYDTGLLVTKDGTDLAAINPDMPMGVASSFKLAVLAILQQQIDNGELSWDTVISLQPEWKSLPSGILQDWPVGSRLTVDTLATLMISISDNTAADALIQTIGREQIEALAQYNQPFLTTKEIFTLKNPENAPWLTRYRHGDQETRRQVLAELSNRPLPKKTLFANDPVDIDVEWFFTPRQLCSLIETVASLGAVQINPGVVNPSNWATVAFKGGSEPGVLNLTTWLQSHGFQGDSGHSYCVSATWNSADQVLNEEKLTEIYRGLIDGLEKN